VSDDPNRTLDLLSGHLDKRGVDPWAYLMTSQLLKLEERVTLAETGLHENTKLTRKVDGTVSKMELDMTDLKVAMFAPNENNANNTPGVMTTMKKLDAHLDALCRFAKWGKALALLIVTLLFPTLYFLRQMGWW